MFTLLARCDMPRNSRNLTGPTTPDSHLNNASVPRSLVDPRLIDAHAPRRRRSATRQAISPGDMKTANSAPATVLMLPSLGLPQNWPPSRRPQLQSDLACPCSATGTLIHRLLHSTYCPTLRMASQSQRARPRGPGPCQPRSANCARRLSRHSYSPARAAQLAELGWPHGA